jgi:hypothetical protein
MTERLFRSMEEIRRAFFPSLCPWCGYEEFETDWRALGEGGRKRTCLRCGGSSAEPKDRP